jgi:hypothetical protein
MTAAAVIYEVNIDVDAEAEAELLAWLPPHIDQLLALDGFIGAEAWAVEDDANATARRRHCVHYLLDSRDALEAYFRDHAERLRGDGARFAGRMTISRRILLRRPR